MSHRAQLRNYLAQAGLNEVEIHVYLELLKRPAEKAWDLVLRTKLPKSSVYRAVDSLRARKLLSVDDRLQACSLKALIADLELEQRKAKKLSLKLKELSPYLNLGEECVEEFQPLFTEDQILEAYLFMAAHNHDVCLDFGDYESFISRVGGLDCSKKFREERIKHAKNEAIMSTWGPHMEYLLRSAEKQQFHSEIHHLQLDIRDSYTVFAEGSDYVLFNNVRNDEVSSVLVKSRVIAGAQRAQFKHFSQELGKF